VGRVKRTAIDIGLSHVAPSVYCADTGQMLAGWAWISLVSVIDCESVDWVPRAERQRVRETEGEWGFAQHRLDSETADDVFLGRTLAWCA
jgi:hypothetical protein